jgi:succinate dehydrogenase/fumarate reductase cytochrome b subunit
MSDGLKAVAMAYLLTLVLVGVVVFLAVHHVLVGIWILISGLLAVGVAACAGRWLVLGAVNRHGGSWRAGRRWKKTQQGKQD